MSALRQNRKKQNLGLRGLMQIEYDNDDDHKIR